MPTASFINTWTDGVQDDDERLLNRRVVLPDDPKERGVIVGVEIVGPPWNDHVVFMVQVDEQYRTCTGDDGLRELCAEDIILLDKED